MYPLYMKTYDVVFVFENICDYYYIFALISEDSLNFGLLTFLRLLSKIGTFKVVFCMLKYDPYTLMSLMNHIVARHRNVVV